VPPPLVYVASPLGFTEAGRRYNDDVLLPALRAHGLEPLDPWAGGGAIVAAAALADPDARRRALARANAEVAAANAAAIEACAAVLAVLDGPDVDSGTAAEIGYASALGRPVVGWRSDLRRSGDNEAAPVNLQVQWFLERTGGSITTDLAEALVLVATLVAASTHTTSRPDGATVRSGTR
jgi:nucleoside 2-deoxyribosyltransferase